MAFNFLGTLSLEQLRELREFIDEQIESIEQELNTLRVELDNAERTRTELLIADGNLGGNALTTIYETELPDVIRIPDQDDTNSAILMEKIKKPFIGHIKFKRERLEYKIKKMTDLIEQLKETIDRKAIAKTQTRQYFNELESLFNSKNDTHLFKTTDEMRNFKQGITTNVI